VKSSYEKSNLKELSIPIGGYQGRGGTGLPIQFDYSSKVWQIKATTSWESQYGAKTDTKPMYAKRTAAGWTSNLGVPRIDYQFQMYKPFIDGISTYDGEIYTPVVSIQENPNPPNYPIYYVKRMFVVMPDGSSHEFRKDDGVYNYGTSTSPGGPGLPDLTGTFLSVDGSRLRLEITENSKTLFMPDGSRYLFGSNDYATSFIDRNGNKMTYDFTNKRWTDTMGRVIDDPMPRNWNDFEQTQVVEDKVAHFPGKDGGTFEVTFSWRYLKDPNGGESGLEDTSQTLNNYSNVGCQGNVNRPIPAPYLFTNPEPGIVRVCNPIGWEGMNWWVGAPFNPIVLTKITLPNGQSYQFKYNVYGEITKIIYPTGAYERFLYGAIEPVQPQGPSYDQANRGVTDRWVSAKGDGTDEIHWSYQVFHGYQQPYKVVTTNPDSTKTEQYLYTEDADAPQPYGFGDVKTGRSYEDRVISSTNQLLRRHLTSYEVTGTTGGYAGATRDLRPNKEVTIIFEPGSSYALAQMTEMVYDTNSDAQYFAQLNPKQVKTYNYIVLDLTTAQTAAIDTIANLFTSSNLARIEETDYLYDANYKARNIVGLPIETRIKDASGTVKAKSQISYDEAAYPVIDYGSTTNWENPNTSYRGNATTTRSWTDVSNNQYIETHAQYDNFGNLRKAWDGRGNLTETEYSATYYYAYPTKVTTPIPDPTGQNGSATAFQTITQYDFNTGLPVSVTDANNQTSQFEYNDALLRLTKVTAANGQETITEYGTGTTDSTRFVKVRTQIETDKWKENYTWFDGLGRTVKTQSIDSAGDVFVETEYDNMGRVKKVSNPYRANETIYKTENFYDDLGRIIKVKSPDNAEVNMVYSLPLRTHPEKCEEVLRTRSDN
jgi:YD repeat-containing protein